MCPICKIFRFDCLNSKVGAEVPLTKHRFNTIMIKILKKGRVYIMELIPQVTCRKCGTEYSSLQSRCPNCGTRKMKQTQRAPGTTSGTVAGTYANEQAQLNVRWQMTFAAILVVAVILAMIVLISTSLSTEPGMDSQQGGAPGQVMEDPNVSATPTPTPTPSPTPTPMINSLGLSYGGVALSGNPPQFTEAVGEDVPLSLSYYPLNVPVTTNDVKWTSADESVCTVKGDNMGCVITGVGTGSTTVSVQLYNQKIDVTVYVRQSW